jgi:hypothetical protein
MLIGEEPNSSNHSSSDLFLFKFIEAQPIRNNSESRVLEAVYKQIVQCSALRRLASILPRIRFQVEGERARNRDGTL